jgi:hypothetical protein
LLRLPGEILALGESEERVAKTNHLGALAAVAGTTLVAVGLVVLMMVVVDGKLAEATKAAQASELRAVTIRTSSREGVRVRVEIADNACIELSE